MFALFKPQKKQMLVRLEHKLYDLVEKKEKEIGTIDEFGRDIVMTLRDYLNNLERGSKNDVNRRQIISQAQRYLRENEHYNY